MLCACAVRKVCYFGPIFPDGQCYRSNYGVPTHRITQIPTQSKNLDNELKQIIFPTKNARFMSKSAAFALWT